MKNLIAVVIMLISFTYSQAQWSPLMRISYARGGFYPCIITNDDTLFVSYTAPNFVETIFFVKSTDTGRNWSSPQIISDTSATNSVDFTQIISLGNRLIAFWRHEFRADSLLRGNIGYSISTNGGQSWSVPYYLLNPNVDYLGHYDVVSSDSVINVIYAYQAGSYPYHIKSIRSTNFGSTWSNSQEIFQSEDFGLLDMASYGDRINVVWTGKFDYSRSREIYHFRSIDGGVSWSDNDTLSMPDGYHSQFPKIASDEAGNLFVVWMDFRTSPYQITGDLFSKASINGGLTWSPETQITFTHYAYEPELCYHNDSIFVAWADWRFGLSYVNIFSIHSTNNGLSWTPEERIEPELYFCADPALAFSNGHAYMVFKDMRCEPDTDVCGGAFFTKFPADPDRIIDSPDILPDEISLSAYPNPFNSNTTLSISEVDKAEIAIFDITGRRVASLHADNGKAIWNATGFSSGLYFANVQGDNISNSVKLILLK
jgi:hypothetical protein